MNRYRFNAPRYNAPFQHAAIAREFSTIAAAIIARFNATPGIANLVTGGIYYRFVPNSVRDNLPYAVLTDITESINENTDGPCYYMSYWQVGFFVAEGDELTMDQIVKAWYATFGPKKPPLVWQGRNMIRFSNTSSRVIDDDRDSPGGAFGQSTEVNQQIIEFLVISSPSSI